MHFQKIYKCIVNSQIHPIEHRNLILFTPYLHSVMSKWKRVISYVKDGSTNFHSLLIPLLGKFISSSMTYSQSFVDLTIFNISIINEIFLMTVLLIMCHFEWEICIKSVLKCLCIENNRLEFRGWVLLSNMHFVV